MKKLFILSMLCIAGFSYAQNLVPNPGFELITAPPDGQGQWDRCVFWSNAGGTASSSLDAAPDLYHTQGTSPVQLPSTPPAFVNPHAGSAIMGFLAYYDTVASGGAPLVNNREYLTTQLLPALTAGETYEIKMWVQASAGELRTSYYNVTTSAYGTYNSYFDLSVESAGSLVMLSQTVTVAAEAPVAVILRPCLFA